MLTYQLIEGAARRQWLDDLLLADEEVGMIERYLMHGQLYTVSDKQQVIGVFHLMALNDQQVELKNIAVRPEWQQRGFGGQMMTQIQTIAIDQGFQSLLVGTGDGSLAAIGFYLRQGFRFEQIRKNFFDEYQTPIYENGIRLKDMVVLAKIL
ncbi:GNAT family N-acetyltransferase [Latilactobacillus curvatus]|uniref:GNAT family N-acetyltransferase n=1 Tax=Latilactobacillus curvatus TaxID=28038 RepID=UPI000FECB994|nr:GNAT family N-acetyltransferase [Latilactobacillus curvatus]QAR34968.1 GNAT family N-acetyltransferase [Latilactobacillus curvatus]